MLRKAKARVSAQRRLTNVDGLAVMDAQHLGFADAVFDVVVAQYVITTVPDPEATLDEFVRVVKPGGEIILVNHLGAETGLRAAFERWLRAAGPAARLASGIRLGTARAMGGAPRRRARHRAAADAAARTFLADQVCARYNSGQCRQPRRSASQWPEHADVDECPRPQAMTVVAGKLAGAAGALAAGADVDADVATPVDMSGYIE